MVDKILKIDLGSGVMPTGWRWSVWGVESESWVGMGVYGGKLIDVGD